LSRELFGFINQRSLFVCMFSPICPWISGTMFAQPLGPCVRAAEGTA
jgi:hypothetical protein